MIFRFSLSHAVLGPLVISEPDGWIATKLKLERHEEYHSLIEYFEGDFVFYGDNGSENGGIDFIRQVENTYGPDAEMAITIEIAPDNINYQTIFVGQLDLWNIEEMPDNKAQIPIIRNDFWAKFINRYDTPVDLQSPSSVDETSIDQFESINLKLPSQKIQQTTRYETENYDDSNTISMSTPELDFSGASDGIYNFYSQIGIDLVQSEIDDSFTLPFSLETSDVGIFNIVELLDVGGPVTINVNANLTPFFIGSLIETSAEPDPSRLTAISCFANLVVKVNNGSPVIIATDIGVDSGPFDEPIVGFPAEIYAAEFPFSLNGSFSYDAVVGDLIYVYVVYGLTFDIDVGADTGNREWTSRQFSVESITSDVEIVIQSTFVDTLSPAFLLHDAAGYVIDRNTGRDQAFYSELLGSDQTIYRQYPADGCQWKYALAKGLQIRRYSLLEKPFFLSFKQWWEGANPILNLGLSYETVAGEEVIRIEEKRHFYDDSEVLVNLDFVRDIVRKYDESRIFKTVKIGYKKWQSEDVSGIDDPQTKKTYATILKKAGRELSLESDFIAASLAIETTRRKTREKSADYKFDNDTFIIAINPFPVYISPETSPDVTDYEPELDENFYNITNLLNSETRYNLRLTPARNFLRWLDWASAGLQAYLSSAFKFSSGEGNYDMTSDMINDSDGCVENRLDLSEKQDIQVSSDPFHLALLYEINCPLEWDDYVLIRDNRKKAIGISQTNDNHVKFFIKDLEYEVVEGRVTIQAWSKEFMEIEVVESSTQMQVCAPVLPCEDAYLTETGDEYITESGDCLILN